jgi:hypothetical protein
MHRAAAAGGAGVVVAWIGSVGEGVCCGVAAIAMLPLYVKDILSLQIYTHTVHRPTRLQNHEWSYTKLLCFYVTASEHNEFIHSYHSHCIYPREARGFWLVRNKANTQDIISGIFTTLPSLHMKKRYGQQ